MEAENIAPEAEDMNIAPDGWENPPKLTDLKQDLQDALPHHNTKVSEIDGWLDNLHVRGNAKPKVAKGRSSVQPKLIRKQAEWRYAALTEPFLSSPDMFKATPRTWEDTEAARQNQILLNYQFNTLLDKDEFIDEYVRTAVDEGTVIVRVAWDFKEGIRRELVPIVKYRINPDYAQVHEELYNLRQQNPTEYEKEVEEPLKIAHETSMERGVPLEPVVVGEEYQDVKYIERNQPELTVCEYKRVIVDPSCNGNLSKANFLIFEVDTSLSELRADGKYKNLDNIRPGQESILGSPDTDGEIKDFNFTDKPRQKFTMYEYWGFWDIDGSGIVKPFVAAWVGNTCVRMEELPYPDKELPFVLVQYLPRRKQTHGEPDGALLEDNQKIAGAVTRGAIDLLAKSANGQRGYRKGALDVRNRRRFEQGMDYEFNGNTSPDQVFHTHKFTEIPHSVQYMLDSQNMEAESMTGVKAFTGGMSGESLGPTAAGVRGVLDASAKRELGILRRLSKGMVKIARKIVAMNAEFLSEEEVVAVTNKEFETIRRADLAGKVDIRLAVTTAEEDNAKAQELTFMLQTTGNNMEPELRNWLLAEISELRRMPELAERLREWEPKPDPLQQENLMLQNQLLKAQIANELSQARENDAEAQLDLAKARREIAHAANLASDTDLKNLDFIEQESGVKQERELQKHGEQARAQTQGKLAELTFKEAFGAGEKNLG